MTDEVANLIRRGLDHGNAGDPVAAIRLWQQALSVEPGNLQARQLVAQSAIFCDQPELAIAVLKDGLEFLPDEARLHHDLAIAHRESGDLTGALTHMQRAAELAPGEADILNNLGGIHEHLGQVEPALDAYRAARDLVPHHPTPHINIGDIAAARGELGEAIDAYRIAATLDPSSALAWLRLGRTLAKADQPAAAMGPLRRAVELGSEDAEAHQAIGDALQTLGSNDEAVASYRRALDLDPENAEAWYGLGHAQIEQKQIVAAAGNLRKCIALAPDHWPARNDLGKVLHDLGCVEEGMRELRQVSQNADQALRAHALRNMAVIAPANPEDDNASVLKIRQAWAQTCDDRPVTPAAPRDPGAPIRIGYVSSYFHRPNWMKPVWALINNHDRTRFQVHLYSDAALDRTDAVYRPKDTDVVRDITALSNRDVAQRIADDGVDILVDLNGYSVPQRMALFATRPAPVIVAWFNMYATTGMPCFDYLIGDDSVIPSAEETHYCEKILRVPHSYLSFEVGHPAPEPVPPPCLENGYVTIGCLCSQYKFTDAVLAAWSRILEQASSARLLIRNAALSDQQTRAHLQDRLAAHGIQTGRVTMLGRAPHFEFLETYNRMDFALDVFPYNGGTTTTEAIWQGVPLLCFNGDRWASRTSASILNGAGFGDWVADDFEGYVALAVEMANAPDLGEKLAPLRAGMRDRLRASPVMDAQLFASNMERLYLDIADREGLRSG